MIFATIFCGLMIGLCLVRVAGAIDGLAESVMKAAAADEIKQLSSHQVDVVLKVIRDHGKERRP